MVAATTRSISPRPSPDVFDDLFGEFMGGKQRRRQNRGGDLRYNLEITLKRRSRAARRRSACRARSPARPARHRRRGRLEAEQCPTCSGNGKVRAQQGFFTIERTCHTCRGTGRIIKNPCKACHGSGHVQKERTLSVDVPPGVE